MEKRGHGDTVPYSIVNDTGGGPDSTTADDNQTTSGTNQAVSYLGEERPKIVKR